MENKDNNLPEIVDNIPEKIQNLPSQEDQDEFNRGMEIAQKIIRQQMFGRKRTKKNRGAQKGAFGQPKINRTK